MPYVVLDVRSVEKHGETMLNREEAPREMCVEAALNHYEKEGMTLVNVVPAYHYPSWEPKHEFRPLLIFHKPE